MRKMTFLYFIIYKNVCQYVKESVGHFRDTKQKKPQKLTCGCISAESFAVLIEQLCS